MLTYQYVCPGCGRRFEVMCKMSEHESHPPCPNPDCPCLADQSWEEGGPDWSMGRSRTN